jgi:hypothetical protein
VRARATVIVTALLLAGCGGQSQTRAHTEISYVNRVNAVEKQLGQPLLAVTQAAAAFAAGQRAGSPTGRRGAHQATTREEATLLGALTRIRALRHSLAALNAPPAAARLRTLLLRLADEQAYLTDQTAKLVVFLPRFAADLGPLSPATLRLERALSIGQAYGAAAVQAVYAEKAAALRAFQGAVDAIIRSLRRLPVPRVSQPGYRAQVRSLDGMGVDAGKLAGVIGSGQTAAISGLLIAFDHAAAANQTRGVRTAQIAAVKAYDTQTAEVNRLAARARLERERLAASLR